MQCGAAKSSGANGKLEDGALLREAAKTWVSVFCLQERVRTGQRVIQVEWSEPCSSCEWRERQFEVNMQAGRQAGDVIIPRICLYCTCGLNNFLLELGPFSSIATTLFYLFSLLSLFCSRSSTRTALLLVWSPRLNTSLAPRLPSRLSQARITTVDN